MSARPEPLPGLGEAIRALRREAGLSQREVARAAKVANASLVGEYERETRQPMPGTLYALLRAMGRDFCDLESALRTARGDEPRQPKEGNGDGPPGFDRVLEAVRDEAVTREIDRRLAHLLREVLGFDPRTQSGRQRS